LIIHSSQRIAGFISIAVSAKHSRNQGYVPFSDAPILCRSENLADPVSKLQEQFDARKINLQYGSQQGYLKSILQRLKVLISSQTIDLSKTSFHYKMITSQTPRALYFNDDVYSGPKQTGSLQERKVLIHRSRVLLVATLLVVGYFGIAATPHVVRAQQIVSLQGADETFQS
jgi:hypothetical protein